MFINREFIGNLATLIFFVGIVSTLFCLAIGASSDDLTNPVIKYGDNQPAFDTKHDSFYEYNN